MPQIINEGSSVGLVERITRSLHAEMLAIEREDGNGGCEFDQLDEHQVAMLTRLATAVAPAHADLIQHLTAEIERKDAALREVNSNGKLPPNVVRSKHCLIPASAWHQVVAALNPIQGEGDHEPR